MSNSNTNLASVISMILIAAGSVSMSCTAYGQEEEAVMEEVTQMTTCMTVCQDALMACYSGG